MIGGLVMARNDEGLLSKINSLCAEDYEKVVSYVNGLVAKTDAEKFLEICSHYDDREPLSMEEIDEEIQAYRRGE